MRSKKLYSETGEFIKDKLFSELLPYEVKILELLAEGMSVFDIALTLGLTIRTVRKYISDILNKTEAKNRVYLLIKYNNFFHNTK